MRDSSSRFYFVMAAESMLNPAEVFDFFCALTDIAPEPGGQLVFCGELDARGMALAAASSIAGAASLGVDESPERVKSALRHGVCDFMVNSLDEALRILKNEIRRKQPVCAGLVGNPRAVVAEMLERGVQPDLVLPDRADSREFLQRGAKAITSAVARDWVDVTWSVEQEPAAWLPRADAIAAESLSGPSDFRLKWLRRAPRYLRKELSRERYVRMSARELERFRDLLREKISAPVSIKGA